MTYWLDCIVWLVSAHRWLRSGFISFCISSVNTLKKNKLHADQLAAPSDLQSPVRPQSTEFHVKNENDTKQTNSIGKPKKKPSRIHVYERFILFRRLKPRRWVGGASARCTISIFLYVFVSNSRSIGLAVVDEDAGGHWKLSHFVSWSFQTNDGWCFYVSYCRTEGKVLFPVQSSNILRWTSYILVRFSIQK